MDGLPPLVGEPLQRKVRIGIAGLVRVTEENAPVIFRDGGGCPGHEPLPHWLTPKALAAVQSTARLYQQKAGRMLSLNDASLPMGGLIDNRGGNGRDAMCHVSHRQGIDIDVNNIDSGGVAVRSGNIEINDVSVPIFRFLNRKFRKHNAFRVIEENSIHYRFSGDDE